MSGEGNRRRKKSWFSEHIVAIVCTLLLIALGYGMFMFAVSMGNTATERDHFESFVFSMQDRFPAIAVLSEYEIGERDPDDTEQRGISMTGRYQEVRDSVSGSGLKEAYTYFNAGKGRFGACYTYETENGTYLVYYEKGIVNDYTDGSEYMAFYGEDILIEKK